MFRLEILGRATIRGQDGPLRGKTVQRQRIALLAVLAVAGERGMSRDRILGLLWPESPEDRARRSLSNALYELRRALGDNAILGSGDDLRLNPADVASDVAEFEAAIQNGEPELAVQLYRGSLLDGFAADGELERWIAQERQRLNREACGAVEESARGAEEWRDYRAAARHWHRLTELDPFSSQAAVSLMKALNAAGDRTAALQHARQHAALILTEFDSAPDPAVSELVAELSETPATTADTPVARPRPSGHTTPSASSAAPASSSSRKYAFSPGRLAAAGLFAVGVLVVGLVVLSTGRTGLDDHLVLVAPFANETGDPELDAFGAVVSDWLARGLQETHMVRVIDPRAVRTRLPGSGSTDSATAWSLAVRLGAGIVVSGSYQRRGDSVLIHPIVTETGSSTLLASVGPVSAPLSDPLAAASRLQDEVTAAVAVRYSPEFVNFAHAVTPPASYEAYRHYVVGSELADRGAYVEAIEQLERAVTIDSTFAVAALYLATAYLNAGATEEADRVAQSLNEHRERLLSAERHLLDWLRAFVEGDLLNAARAARRANEVAPHAPDFAHLAGLMALLSGRAEEALDILATVDRDYVTTLGDPGLWDDLSTANHLLGRHEEELDVAADARRRFPELLEPLLFQVRALGALGRGDEIQRVLEHSLTINSDARGFTVGMLAREASRSLRAHSHDATEIAQWGVDWYETTAHEGMKEDDVSYLFGMARYEAEQWTEARDLFAPLLSTYREHPGVLGHLALVAHRVGEEVESVRLASRLSSLDPRYHSGAPALWRARLAALRGDSTSAERLIRQAFAEGLPWGFDLMHAREFHALAARLWSNRDSPFGRK